LTEQVSFAGFEKDGKTVLDESQCVRLAASDTTSLEMFKERHAQVLEMWEQGRCYSPLGLFYTSVRDNYDPRSEGRVSEEMELEQVVKRATRLMQHQSQQGEEEGSSDGEVAGNSAAVGATCSENEPVSSKDTYPTNKRSSSTRISFSRATSTNAPTNQFSFRKPEYNNQPRQSYYRNNNFTSYGSRSRTNRSNWQSSSYSSYRPSYLSWIGSNLAEGAGEVAPAYNEEEEEITAEETQMYQAQSAFTQQIDPVVTLERMCNWLGSILRRPDLARKLAGVRLELGKDESGENRATFWLANEGIDPTSFSLGDRSLIRMAFSTEVAPHYKLELGRGQILVSIQ
jgi:hypothetical protein